MQTSLPALLAILGMAGVTYLTRIGGLLLMRRVQLSEPFKRWIQILPGTILMSIVAPLVLSTGLAEMGAALATIVTALVTRNVLLSMIVGVVVVIGLRFLHVHL